MNIDSVNPIPCRGNIVQKLKNVKLMDIPLKDCSTVRPTTADNCIECLMTKGEKNVESYGKISGREIMPNNIRDSYEKIQAHVKDGLAFFKEFVKVILS